ncbi:hypothetical protein [Stenotrophomonas maltophilia]
MLVLPGDSGHGSQQQAEVEGHPQVAFLDQQRQGRSATIHRQW